MKIPIHYTCDCGVADTLLIDEDQAIVGSLICTDCRHCRSYTICVNVKFIDKPNRKIEFAILKGKIEKCDY